MQESEIEDEPSLRLAFRHENEWWCAYLASPGSMQGAILIAKTHMATVQDEGMKQAFIEFCRAGFNCVMFEEFGIRVAHWGEPQPAPVHEKGKA